MVCTLLPLPPPPAQPRVQRITPNSPPGLLLKVGLSLGHSQRKKSGRARVTWRKEAFRQPQWRLLEDEIREQRPAVQGTVLLCSGRTLELRRRRPRSPQASEVPGHLGCPGLSFWTCGLYSISPDKIPPWPSVLLARTPPGLIRVSLPRFQAHCWGKEEGVVAARLLRQEWTAGRGVGGT